MSEFESHWVLHSYGLVPHQNKKLSKLHLRISTGKWQYLKAFNCVQTNELSLIFKKSHLQTFRSQIICTLMKIGFWYDITHKG